MAKNNQNNPSKVKEEKTYKITDLKYNVVTPVNLSCILEPVELAIFIAILHQCNVSNKPISLSMIAGFTGLTKSRVSGNVLSLERLRLVDSGRKTKIGTFYHIETENIVKLLTDFNEIKDPVIRLQIGDLIRAFSGLETKNKSAIKLFSGSEKTGVYITNINLAKTDADTFNVGISLLNEFNNMNTNEIWFKYEIKVFILKCIINRLYEIGEIVNLDIDYNEQKEEYYGKAK